MGIGEHLKNTRIREAVRPRREAIGSAKGTTLRSYSRNMIDENVWTPPPGPFCEVFRFHLEVHGTRPGGSRIRKGEPWRKSDFAEKIGITSKEVVNILAGKYLPSNTGFKSTLYKIRSAFFGSNKNYDEWVVNFNYSYSIEKTPINLSHASDQAENISSSTNTQIDKQIYDDIHYTIKQQFRNSVLYEINTQKDSLNRSILRLRDIGIAKEQILPKNDYLHLLIDNVFLDKIMFAHKPSMVVGSYRTKKVFRVQSLNIFPSAVAALLFMIESGFEIDLHYDYGTGRNLALMLDVISVPPWDILITGEAGTYLSQGKIILGYEQILCVSNVDQFGYALGSDLSEPKQLLFTPGTSAEEQILFYKKRKQSVDPKEAEFDTKLLLGLERRQAVIRWDPFDIPQGFQKLNTLYYPFYFSLFANKIVMTKCNNDLILFLNGFVAAWNFLTKRPWMAMELIRKERKFHLKFAEEAGIRPLRK